MQKPCYSILLLVWLVSCHAPKNVAQSESNLTLKAIARKPAMYEGKEVKLEGNFLGWKYSDCHFPKSFSSVQITRSDWVIHDGKKCCFVTGSIPKGLDPASSDPVPVKLTALVKMKESKVYLEVVNVVLK
jgi:hypothetical protein